MVVFALLLPFDPVLGFVPRIALVGDEADRAAAESLGTARSLDAGRAFDGVRWMRDQWRIRDRGLRPDFVVVPDVVAGGEDSLEFSARERPFVAPDAPAYLVVQDGMTTERVGQWLIEQPDPYHGIFVGGTLEWKLATSAAWVTFAHECGMKCHIGRCGPPDRVRWAHAIGADSIDSCLPLRDRGKLRAFVDALGLEIAEGT